MRKASGNSSQPVWVSVERDALAKSISFDGTNWTVRRYNDKRHEPICVSPTAETKALLTFISEFDAGHICGSQVKWADQTKGPAMLNTLSGDYPLLYGYEIADIRPSGTSQLMDGANRAAIKADIEAKYAAGKIITIVDHLPNFLTGGDWYDRNNKCMKEIAPGGSKNSEFTAYLDRLVDFLGSLESGGKKVPVLLRIFHEVKLAAFWWSNWSSSGTSDPAETDLGWVTDAEYLAAYRYAVGYLKARLSNVLYVYCQGIPNGGAFPNAGQPAEWYQRVFPGPEYCDIISCDAYANGATPFAGRFTHAWLTAAYDACAALSVTHSKPFALAETGFAYSAQRWGEDPSETGGFWNEVFLAQLRQRPVQPKYFMLWYDQYGPLSATLTAASATAMLQDSLVQMASDVTAAEIYG